MKKLVIFDLDGTLLNTISDLAAATNQALRFYNYSTHSDDAYRFFVGDGINKLFERALPEHERNEENILKIRNKFIPYYNEHGTDLSKPYKGIVELLKEIESRNIMLAVASNKYQSATEELVNHYFGNIKFIAILGQREGIPPKPNPTIVEDIINVAGVEKKDILYVGDTNIDMRTAKNAGVDAVGVTWGFRPKEELASHNPFALVDNAEEILNLLD